MKHFIIAALSAVSCFFATAEAAPFPKTLPGGWKYAWGDEFDGSKLDLSKWAYELGVIRNRGASQTYTKNCVEVKGGKLILHSKAKETPVSNYKPGSSDWREQIKTQPFASGSVTTKGVTEFTIPGRLEFRAKVPKARGVWPAIWTMHVNDYSWPANGEIDILEHISQEPDSCYSIFRWGKAGGNKEEKVVKRTKIPNYSRDFHDYALQWDDEEMFIEIDGKVVGRIQMSQADYPNGDNPLRTPCYLIINTALGGQGTWPQKAVAEDFPVKYEIDYVRYYTKGDNVKNYSSSKRDKSLKKKYKKKKRKSPVAPK